VQRTATEVEEEVHRVTSRVVARSSLAGLRRVLATRHGAGNVNASAV
jgi:hypothetical protein